MDVTEQVQTGEINVAFTNDEETKDEQSTSKPIASISSGDVQFDEMNSGIGAETITAAPLSDIPLSSAPEDTTEKKIRIPRRVIHCSDGVIEEYSTDEEDTVQAKSSIDPHMLKWFPWMWYYVVTMFFGVLAATDFCGEKLAWLLGITSPKYQYAIDEFHRLKQEDEEEAARDEREKQAALQRKLKDFSNIEGGLMGVHSENPTTTPNGVHIENQGDCGLMGVHSETPTATSIPSHSENHAIGGLLLEHSGNYSDRGLTGVQSEISASQNSDPAKNF